MGCDLFKPIQLSERPAFLPPIRNKKDGLGAGKKKKQCRQDLKNIPLMARENVKDVKGREIESYLSGLAAVAEKFLDESTKAGKLSDVCGVLMASWNFRQRQGRWD